MVLAVEVPAGIIDGALCCMWLKATRETFRESLAMPMECWHVFPRAICSNNLQGILDNAWYRTLAQQDFREPSEGSAVRLYVDASCCLKTGGRLHGDAILTAKYVRVSGAACCQRPPRFRHRRFLVRRAGAWTLGANACTIGVVRIRFWAHYSKEPPK